MNFSLVEPMSRLVFLVSRISLTPELMPLQSNFCSGKSNLWTIRQASSWSPEQSRKLIQATSLSLKTVEQSSGNSTSQSFINQTKNKKRKKEKKLLRRGEEHVLGKTLFICWRKLTSMLLKTNPIKEEPLVDVAKNHVAYYLLVDDTASCEKYKRFAMDNFQNA